MTAAPAGLLGAVELAPRDPILGVTEAFVADPNPRKVNLGVGVYVDDNGKVPVLECVRKARARDRRARRAARLSADRRHPRLRQGRAAAAVRRRQRARRARPRRHRAGARRHGRPEGRRRLPAQVRTGARGVDQRPELGEPSRAVRRRGLHRQHVRVLRRRDARSRLRRACSRASSAFPPARIVVLHACCHNPTGVDPTAAQWDAILDIVRARGLVPFLDLAYQGFGDGIDADAAVVRRFAATPGPLFVSSSFSKSFSLYGERVGALSRRHGRQGRSRARAVAGQARRALQLFEPADARRPDRRAGARHAGAARDLGDGARRHARAHPLDARIAGREAARARCRAPTSATCSRSAACSRTRG